MSFSRSQKPGTVPATKLEQEDHSHCFASIDDASEDLSQSFGSSRSDSGNEFSFGLIDQEIPNRNISDFASKGSRSNSTTHSNTQISLTSREVKTLLQKVNKLEGIDLEGVSYYETSNFGLYFVYDIRTKVLLAMSEKNFQKKKLQSSKEIFQTKLYNLRVQHKDCVVLFIRNKTIFKPQIKLFSDLTASLSKMRQTFAKVSLMVNNGKKVFSEQGFLWVLELINMMLNLRDGYFTPSKMISIVISIYTMYSRAVKIFTPQSFEEITFDSASILLSIIGLPQTVIQTIRDYTALTGKKLFSSQTIMNAVLSLYQLFKHFLKWMVSYASGSESNFYLINYADYLIDLFFGNIVAYDKIKKVSDLHAKYVSSPDIILNPEFRFEVQELSDSLVGNTLFLDYVANHENKFFRGVWESFNNTLVKYVKTFTVSSKEEPICIVFEGAPGSGKSVLMNNFVQVLRKQNRSVYVHSIPPTDAGKDFYDDYENQEVFVMDDIGQQGKSQWRTIINFVSPVKYPLECANALKKNTKFFNSKIILCTTNGFMQLRGFTAKDCISEPEALFRRCHVIKVEKSNTEEFSQNLTYYKFDHLSPNTQWKNEFLHQCKGIQLKTQVQNLSKISALSYVRQLLENILSKEDQNRKSTQLSDIDITNAINNEDFKPQTLTDLNTFLMRLYQDWNTSYKDIFLEWYDSLLKPIISVCKSLINYLTNLLFGSSLNPEIRNIFSATSPSDILGSREEYVKNYHSLSLKYHPDKFDGTVKYGDHNLTQEETTLVFIIVALAYRNYDAPIAFFNDVKTIYTDPRGEFYYKTIKDNLGVKHHEFCRSTYAATKNILLGIPDKWSKLGGDEKFFIQLSLFYLVCVLGIAVASWFGEPENYDEHRIEKDWRKWQKEHKFIPQTHIDVSVQKHLKYAVISDGNGKNMHTHAIVSGDRFLITDHTLSDEGVVTIYATYEHYVARHPQVENVKFKVVSNYVSCDLKVCQFLNFHPFFPKAHALFRTRDITPIIKLQSSHGSLDLIFDKNVFRNSEAVEYTGYSGKQYNHMINDGLFTPVEGEGLCGSFIFNTHGDIIAIHVAGDGKTGFCVIPSQGIADMIRDDMFNCHNLDLDLDTRVKSDFSGVRLVYPTNGITPAYVSGKTKIIQSSLHVDVCPEMAKFIEVVKTLDEPIIIDPKIDRRGPPIIDKPYDKLRQTAQKSFANQGDVSNDELKFVKDCMREYMPKFKYTDLDEMETAFGSDEIARINSESSDGYGHPVKTEYFDFDNKIIKPAFLEECALFEERVRSDNLEFKDFLTKEVFKVDELRNESKRETPRTIRVMPITNIWYTKRIFGNLAKFIKQNRKINGIGYGFNPYRDMDRVYKKLKSSYITGDLDASKWDGTLCALIMEALIELMFEQYNGKFLFMKSYLIKSIVRAFVLIGDELYATTHGLPSGTWVTLLLNSLYNKALDALVLYRKHPKPSVDLFLQIYSEVTGDDKVFGVPQSIAPYVNLLTYKEVFESLGMKCTNGDKTEITSPSQSLEKLTYLKRHFRFHPVLQRWVGPLSANTILNIPQWIDKSMDYDIAMNGKMRAVQLESYLHSPALFVGITNLFKKRLGYDRDLFTEQEVIHILNDEDGYCTMLELLNKYDYSKI